jgi:3-deoxy-D-manno-octulosonic-acid transferase
MKGTFLLLIYRAASAAFAPFAPLFLYWRQKQGLEDKQRVKERLGISRQMRPAGPLAWLHGVSVGESLALLPLLERLAARGFHILLTTATVTSAAVVAQRLPPGALHQYIPLDVPRFMARFLDHWHPDFVFIAESEIWPNLFREIHRRDIPLVLVNARISERSFRRWRRLPRSAQALMEKTEFCLAQSLMDAERLTQLGVPRVYVAGNLKYDVAPPPADPQSLADLKARVGGRPVWLAAATHTGEDQIVFDVHRRLLPHFPDLLTIIVPRHPRRGAEIKHLAESRGLRCQLRSEDRRGEPLEGLYISDTIGETGLFYRLSGIAFIGKSLAGAGGQSPIEAAKLGCAILHGPNVANFTDVYERLDATHGAATVVDAETLARALAYLLADAAKMRDMARAATEVVESLGGASDFIMKAIEPHIAQMMVEQRVARS